MDSGIHRASGSTRVRWIRGSIRHIGYEFGDPSQGWWPGGAPAPGERPMGAPRPRRRGAALAAVVSEVDSGVDPLLRRRRPGGFGDRPPETWVDSAIHLRRPAPSARNRPSARQAGSVIITRRVSAESGRWWARLRFRDHHPVPDRGTAPSLIARNDPVVGLSYWAVSGVAIPSRRVARRTRRAWPGRR